MSIFLPYSPSVVLAYFTNLFSVDVTQFTEFESLITTLLANLYFYVYWFFIIYFALKIFNRLYERLF